MEGREGRSTLSGLKMLCISAFACTSSSLRTQDVPDHVSVFSRSIATLLRMVHEYCITARCASTSGKLIAIGMGRAVQGG